MTSNDSTTRICDKHSSSDFYWAKNRSSIDGGQWKCKACNVAAVSESRRNQKKQLVAILGGKCASCGYDKYFGALEFHHVDRKTKKFTVARNGLTRSIHKVLDEIKKCVLVCANCHREIESGIRPCPALQPLIENLIPPTPVKRAVSYVCPNCGGKKCGQSKRCGNCAWTMPRNKLARSGRDSNSPTSFDTD